jgi:hypothetical protein
MSPENCLIKTTNKLKEKTQYLHSALDECKKIINSLEKQQEVLVESKKITERLIKK